MQIPFVHNLVLMPLLLLDWEAWLGARAPGDVDWDREWQVAWKPHPGNAWFAHQAHVLGAMVRRTDHGGGRVLKTDAFEEACRLPSLADGHGRPVLMDVSPRILARAAAAMGCATDVRRLAFRGATFGTVVSHSTLDHFADEGDIGRALGELHRVLAPDGRLVVTLDNPENPVLAVRRAIHEVAGRIGGLIPFAMGRTLPRAARERALEHAGFTVVESAYVLHTPRVVGLWLGEWAARARLPRLGRALARAFGSLERVLGALPTRRWTAHFVVADCRAGYRAER
jgi:SAM-dependent methyltransferase